jgi:hypothetical protein
MEVRRNVLLESRHFLFLGEGYVVYKVVLVVLGSGKCAWGPRETGRGEFERRCWY